MKSFISTFITVAFFGLTLGGAKAYSQYYDDIYISPTKAREQREKQNKVDEQRREIENQEQRRRKEALQQTEQEEAYYYDPVDEKGFTQYEIDAYNRRNGSDTISLKKERVLPSQKTTHRGKYAERILRFHSGDAVVIERGDRTYIITDDSYYSYYDEYEDGSTVNIYITGAPSFWGHGYYPWYDPFYDPWHYDPWYRHRYWGSRYHPHWGWGGWAHCGWGYPSWGSSWHNGYHHGYHDGYSDGYYAGGYGSQYDPYSGRSYQNNYPYGRQSAENFGGRHNEARQNGSAGSYNGRTYEGGRSSSNASPERSQHARGTFWTDPNSKNVYNTSDNNYARERVDMGAGRERGVFEANNNNRGTFDGTGRISPNFENDSRITGRGEERGVYRIPQRARLNESGKNERAIGHVSRERGVFSQERGRSSNRHSIDNPRKIERSQRRHVEPSRRDIDGWQPQRTNNTTHNSYERSSSSSTSRGTFGTGSNNSSSGGNSSRNNGGGGNHNSGGR